MTKKQIAAPVIRRQFVSVATLARLHACATQQAKFAHAFNVTRRDRVEINVDNVKAAWDAGIMIEWLIYRVLDRSAMRSYIIRQRNLTNKYMDGQITGEERHQRRAELIVKYLREGWSKR